MNVLLRVIISAMIFHLYHDYITYIIITQKYFIPTNGIIQDFVFTVSMFSAE